MVLDTPVRLVHLDHQVQQDTPHLVNLEAQVHLENQVHLDIQARRDTQGLQDLKVQEECQDHLEALDLLAFLLLESLDHTVFQDQWAHVEKLALRVILEFLDCQARKENLAMVFQEDLVAQVQWALRVLLVSPVSLELENQDQVDFLESLESQECQVGMGHQVLWAYQAQRVIQGHLE
ncbi:hypothetical protein R3I93_011890 [Phoxinus phoxinus]|uniref:Uncharacterized protein n=1 Tax=Phoxinus phoxinus TaxID=58324 RepID=A0AAN9H3S8_9TELE